MRWFGRRRAAESAARWADVPPGQELPATATLRSGRRGAPPAVPPGAPTGPVDRLRVDGTVVPVRADLAEFAADVRARRVALLRTTFRLFSVSGPDYPLFRLTEAGAGNLTERSTLCCLACAARHSITTLQVGMLTRRAPTTHCLRCGCPDAVLVHDPAATLPDQPHDLRPVSD